VTYYGHDARLLCPECEELCQAVPPMKIDQRIGAWWEEGQSGTCECGANVEVIVSDGCVELCLVESEEE
jgi:hypothetical protein